MILDVCLDGEGGLIGGYADWGSPFGTEFVG